MVKEVERAVREFVGEEEPPSSLEREMASLPLEEPHPEPSETMYAVDDPGPLGEGISLADEGASPEPVGSQRRHQVEEGAYTLDDLGEPDDYDPVEHGANAETQAPPPDGPDPQIGSLEQIREEYREKLGLLPPKIGQVENPVRKRLKKLY